MIDDPWKDLTPPSASDNINARRVSADLPWGFFWARNIEGECLLVLQHSDDSTPHKRLPKLKAIEVTISESKKSGGRMLVFKLLDSKNRDIFHRLCQDIIAGAGEAPSEIAAVEISLARTWRWHHLLRGGGSGLLTIEEQKGLIGELMLMERFLLKLLPVSDVVLSWRGPLGAPKDFEIGRVFIEVKARRGGATPHVVVNSEYQLDNADIDLLFLNVIDLDRATSESKDGFTVADIAKSIRDQIEIADPSVLDQYEQILISAGFRWEDDYSEFRWIEGINRFYQVNVDFPRITGKQITLGVTNVSYSLALSACEPFVVTPSEFEMALKGARNAN